MGSLYHYLLNNLVDNPLWATQTFRLLRENYRGPTILRYDVEVN